MKLYKKLMYLLFPPTNQGYQLARDRQRRLIKPPQRYGHHADLVAYALTVASEIDDDEPTSYKDAMNSNEKDKWTAAMQEEMSSLLKNRTWDLVAKPQGQRIIGSNGSLNENKVFLQWRSQDIRLG